MLMLVMSSLTFKPSDLAWLSELPIIRALATNCAYACLYEHDMLHLGLGNKAY
jgi:hypothetical protein